MRIRFLAFCVAFFAGSVAGAVGVTGTTTTSVLVTDREPGVDSTVSRMPVYESVHFSVGDFGIDQLSVEGGIRAWRDVLGNSSDQSDVRLYRALLRWKDPNNGLNIGAGRQLVAEGVGRANIDGLFVRKDGQGYAFSGFVGQPLLRTMNTWERWGGKALQWGALAQYRPIRSLKFDLSYTEMHTDTALGLRLVGLNSSYRLSDVNSVRARIDMNVASPGVDRVSGWIIHQPSSGRIYTVEGLFRAARLWDFSPLGNVPGIGGKGLASVAATAVQPIGGDFRSFLALTGFTSGGVGGTTNVGVWWRTLRVSYLFSTSGAITGNGLELAGSYRFNRILSVGGRSHYARYTLDDAADATQALGSAAWISLTPLRRLEITAEVREVTDSQYDYRFEGLFFVRYGFELFSAD